MSWLDRVPRPSATLRAKRVFDVVAAGAGLGLLAPVCGAGVLLVWRAHGWPPFFTQRRPGLHGVPFQLIKLRTMTNERGPDGELLPDADRLTKLGRFLRGASVDELPELWNVLIGEMSLVGPRPLLMQYLERYDEQQMRRHDMPPGITGWAQINGRNAISWEEKFELDVWYVDNHTFWLDLRILVDTVSAVVFRRGISAEGEATMPVFMGSASVSSNPRY